MTFWLHILTKLLHRFRKVPRCQQPHASQMHELHHVKTSLFFSNLTGISPCRQSLLYIELELELELDASVNPSYPTDDIGEESQTLYISPFVSKKCIVKSVLCFLWCWY